MFRPVAVLFVLAISLVGRSSEQTGTVQGTNLWAAISVSAPEFVGNETDRLMVQFALVNDGPSAVNPDIGSSHFFINGVEPSDWAVVTGNGPKAWPPDALASGRFLSFGYGLGRYFKKPGIYTVRWEGRQFRSSEVVFRVMPKAPGRSVP